jgi:BirA family biotin operon repressor/biotin-[acetyl-CoA-carboxylase] ligase
VKPREEWHLSTAHIGRRVLVYDRVDSTNSVSSALAVDPEDAGTVVLADEQTAGRGQYGRHWQCPPGAGVLMSVLLFPPPPLNRPAILTAWAAVSVCESIRQFAGLRARIKWPNDVLIDGKKVCGILIEQGIGTVVGIGLNVNQPAEAFEAPGLTHGSSLSLLTGKPLVCYEVARRLIFQLDEEYQRLHEGDLDTLEACWRWRLDLLGRPVVAECADHVRCGRLRSVAFNGVELETAEGVISLSPECIKHLDLSGNDSARWDDGSV